MTNMSTPSSSASVYIATMTGETAQERFPAIRGLPAGVRVFVVVSDQGEPLLVTDSHAEAVRQVRRHKRYVLRSCH